jgi:predicted phage replisome organizer
LYKLFQEGEKMTEVKWIKLSVNMFEDEKIRLIESLPESDTILILWIKLLAQAGKTNASGYIYLNEHIPYTDEMLATIFHRPIGTVRLALKTFEQFGMIEINDDHFISIANWEKHQNLDGLQKIREQERIRKQRQREKQKLLVSRDSHGTVTQSHATEVEVEVR